MGLDVAQRAPAIPQRRSLRRSIPITLGLWALIVLIVHLWGNALNARAPTKVFAPPLFGQLDWHISGMVLVPLVVATVVVVFGPRVAHAASWRALLVGTFAASVAWALALALIDGPGALVAPLESRLDYLVNLPLVTGDFLATYSDNLGDFSIHAQGHPPGVLLLLNWLDEIGLGGAGATAAIAIAAGASAGPAALIVTKAVAHESGARRVAPFLALTPAALWIATSIDTLYLGVAAWGIAAMAVACRIPGRASDTAALAGGALLGAGLFMSYGLVPLGLIVIAIAVLYKRMRPLLLGALGVAAVVAAYTAAGFWWFGGLAATVERYHMGVASQRPYSYFVIANLAAFSLALGPAVVIALTRPKFELGWLIPGAALGAVLAADLSGLAKGEVERIWLPLVPWLTTALAWLPRAPLRPLLAAQASIGLIIGVGIRTPW